MLMSSRLHSYLFATLNFVANHTRNDKKTNRAGCSPLPHYPAHRKQCVQRLSGSEKTVSAFRCEECRFQKASYKTKKVAALLLLALTLLYSCSDTSSVRNVTYKVTGTAAAYDVTLMAPNGSITQYSSVVSGTSWSATANAGDYVSLSAQNATDQGSVTATILVDGSTFKTATSTGAFVIASVSGDIP